MLQTGWQGAQGGAVGGGRFLGVGGGSVEAGVIRF